MDGKLSWRFGTSYIVQAWECLSSCFYEERRRFWGKQGKQWVPGPGFWELDRGFRKQKCRKAEQGWALVACRVTSGVPRAWRDPLSHQERDGSSTGSTKTGNSLCRPRWLMVVALMNFEVSFIPNHSVIPTGWHLVNCPRGLSFGIPAGFMSLSLNPC